MAITLQPITAANWKKVVKLKLAEHQSNWVAPNWYSLLQAHYEFGTARAIAADEEIVGFVLYGQVEGDPRWWIVRLMIDVEQQQKGYGRAALQAIITEMRQNPACTDIYLSFVPGNDPAQKLYESLGFINTGQIEDGELVMHLPYS